MTKTKLACYLAFLLAFGLPHIVCAQSWYKNTWVPPQYAGVTDQKYAEYTSLLRQSTEWIINGLGDAPTFAYHNRFIAYMHLKAPKDTIIKYWHEAIDFNPVKECEGFSSEKLKYDTLFPKEFHYEWLCTLGQCKECNARFDKKLMPELTEIFKDDQDTRDELSRIGDAAYKDENPWVKQLWKKQAAKDSINEIKITKIISQYGYPGRSLVGSKLSEVTFYVIQHAPLEYQEKYLPLVKAAALNREITMELYGYLLDRIKMFRGEKQKYGTQTMFNNETNQLEIYPIENFETLDNLRKYMGMEPLSVYMKSLGVTIIKK